MAEAKLGQVILQDVRLSFPHLFKPSAAVKDGPLKYRAAFIMDPSTPSGRANIKAIEAAIEEVKRDTWKDKADRIKLKADRICFVDGDECTNEEGEVYLGYEGMKIVSASNGKRVPVVDRKKTPVEESDGIFYGGCFVDAVIRLYTVSDQDKGGNGIFASLEAVRFRRDGDAFGSAPVDVDEVFDDLPDDDDDMI